MRYFIHCVCLLGLLAAGCSGALREHADTSAPPAAAVDLSPAVMNKSPKTKDSKRASAKSDAGNQDKSAAPEAAGTTK